MDVNTFLLSFTEKQRKRRITTRLSIFYLKTQLNFILQIHYLNNNSYIIVVCMNNNKDDSGRIRLNLQHVIKVTRVKLPS